MPPTEARDHQPKQPIERRAFLPRDALADP
jgi:hypothetical protein